jgi:hypothetical protein
MKGSFIHSRIIDQVFPRAARHFPARLSTWLVRPAALAWQKSMDLPLQQMPEVTGHVDNFAPRRYNASFALSIKTLS